MLILTVSKKKKIIYSTKFTKTATIPKCEKSTPSVSEVLERKMKTFISEMVKYISQKSWKIINLFLKKKTWMWGKIFLPGTDYS